MVHSFRLLVPPLSQLTAEFGFFRAGEYGVGALQKAEAMFLMVVVFLWYGCQKAFVKGRHPVGGPLGYSQRPPVGTSVPQSILGNKPTLC